MNAEFLKLHIICNRTRKVLMCNNLVYFSAPSLSPCDPPTSFALATALVSALVAFSPDNSQTIRGYLIDYVFIDKKSTRHLPGLN